MKIFAVVTNSGEIIYIDADYFKIRDGEIHFYIGAEKRSDIYVSSSGTIVVPEDIIQKKKMGLD